jgi:hypothetical protein
MVEKQGRTAYDHLAHSIQSDILSETSRGIKDDENDKADRVYSPRFDNENHRSSQVRPPHFPFRPSVNPPNPPSDET